MSGQTSIMMAHDKAEPSRLKQELRRSKRSKRSKKSKKSKNELVKNLQLEEPKTSAKNKDTIHNEEPNTESSDPQSNKTSEYMDHMDDEYGGENYGTIYTSEYEDGGEYCGTLYTECALCSTPIRQYGEEYCNEGCPKEVLDKLGEYLEGVITRDEYLEQVIIRNNNKEISTLASETAMKNIDADSSKNSCNTKNTGDTARSNLKVTAENALETTKSEETVAECAVDPGHDANVLPVLEETDALVPDTALVLEGPAGDTPSLLAEDDQETHQLVPPGDGQDSAGDTLVMLAEDDQVTTSLVPMFKQPGLASNFTETVIEKKICLENAFMESPQVIFGVVRVLNIAFNKAVTVRWTVNDWATHKETDCEYVQGSSRGNMDKFSFKLVTDTLVEGSKLKFCLKYECAGTHWDSNGGNNYIFQADLADVEADNQVTSTPDLAKEPFTNLVAPQGENSYKKQAEIIIAIDNTAATLGEDNFSKEQAEIVIAIDNTAATLGEIPVTLDMAHTDSQVANTLDMAHTDSNAADNSSKEQAEIVIAIDNTAATLGKIPVTLDMAHTDSNVADNSSKEQAEIVIANVLEESGALVGQHIVVDCAKIPAIDAKDKSNAIEGSRLYEEKIKQNPEEEFEESKQKYEEEDEENGKTTRKFKMETMNRAAQQLSSAELTKPQNGANGQFNLIIKRLQKNWRERKDEKCFLLKIHETKKKIKLHTTRYGNIVNIQNQNEKYYHKCGHIHGSAKCCKTKFTQIGTRYGNVEMSTGVKNCLWLQCGKDKSGYSAL